MLNGGHRRSLPLGTLDLARDMSRPVASDQQQLAELVDDCTEDIFDVRRVGNENYVEILPLRGRGFLKLFQDRDR